MTSVTSLRIDAAIQPASYLRWLLYVGLTGIMIVLAWLAPLVLWQYILISIISLAVISYLMLSRQTVLHLSQPPLDQRIDKDWQLLIRTGRGDQLWQAQLTTVHRYQWLMVFEFEVVEPYQRSLSTTVFRDQVDSKQWREFSILTNMSAGRDE